jgi:hypothetical protein
MDAETEIILSKRFAATWYAPFAISPLNFSDFNSTQLVSQM